MLLEKVKKSQRGKMETKTGQVQGGLAGQHAHVSISDPGLRCADIPPRVPLSADLPAVYCILRDTLESMGSRDGSGKRL